jgi:hypothetical protein
MALGYAVRPAAQGSPTTPRLSESTDWQFRVEPAGADRVRIVLPTGRTLEDSHFDLTLFPRFLMVSETPTTTDQRPAGVAAPPNTEAPKGYLFMVPTQSK